MVCDRDWGEVNFPKRHQSKICSECRERWKFCPKCKSALPLTEFRKWKGKIKTAPYCTTCAHARHHSDFQSRKNDPAQYRNLNEYVKTYYKTEAGKISRSLAYWNRIARMAGYPGVSKAEWMSVLERYGGKCAYCQAEGQMSIDHVTPVYLGGIHEKSNVVPACRACNADKHYKRVEDEIQRHKQLRLFRS
jgi:hypothetical protein